MTSFVVLIVSTAFLGFAAAKFGDSIGNKLLVVRLLQAGACIAFLAGAFSLFRAGGSTASDKVQTWFLLICLFSSMLFAAVVYAQALQLTVASEPPLFVMGVVSLPGPR